jgi:hypothetical protein
MKTFVAFLIFILNITSLAAWSQDGRIVLYGKDGQGGECAVKLGENEYSTGKTLWVSLHKSQGGSVQGRYLIDDKVGLPFKPTKSAGGECSGIAGIREDTVIVDQENKVVIQRSRHVEGLATNWIQEVRLHFLTDGTEGLSAVEFRVGAKAATGYGACRKLHRGALAQKYVCRDLRLKYMDQSSAVASSCAGALSNL